MDRKGSSGRNMIEPLYCSYENYNDVSKYYDIYRKPVATEIIIARVKELAAQRGVAAEDLVLADFGCGTGNYVKVLLDALNFKKYIGVEYCEGMINRCRAKFAQEKRVELIQGSIIECPLASESVDVVIINQVLHHLDAIVTTDKDGNHDYPNMRKTLSEVYRVLTPGGIVLINIIEPLQLKGFWQINHLMIGEELIKMMAKFASHEFFRKEMTALGFTEPKMTKISEYLMDDKYYLNVHLVHDPNYRKANSYWALLTEKQTENALKLFNRIIAFFGEEEFQKIIKKEAEFYGQSTELFAVKQPKQ